MKIRVFNKQRNSRYRSMYLYDADIIFEDPDGDPINGHIVYEMDPPPGYLLNYAPPSGSRAIVLVIDIPEQITIGGQQIDRETIFNPTTNEKYIELIKAIEEVL